MYTGNIPHYLDKDHPNFERWSRSRKISFERGKFVRNVLSRFKELRNLKILDIGSGFGGTVENFLGDGNQIYSVEIDKYKLQNQIEHPAVKKILSNALTISFEEKFDIIILQDFIEHIEKPESYIQHLLSYLKEDGLIYLSTPNKQSIFNFISDPHWGFPFISMMSRKQIKKFFIPLFRKFENNREDIAELLSLSTLIKIFNNLNLKFYLQTKFAIQIFFENPRQIIWSDLHISFQKILKSLRLQNIVARLANDKIGIINKYFTPTFYFVLKK